MAPHPPAPILALGLAGDIELLQMENGGLLERVPAHGYRVTTLSFDRTGEWLASGGKDALVRIFRVQQHETRWTVGLDRELRGHDGELWSVLWSPDGRTLLSRNSTALKLWDVAGDAFHVVAAGNADHESAHCVRYSPDGKLLVGCGDAGEARAGWIEVWDAASGRSVFSSHAGAVVSAATFSPDQGHLLACTHGGEVRAWRAGDWRQEFSELIDPAPAGSHVNNLAQIAIDARGELFSVASHDGKVQLLDGKTGRAVRTLASYPDRVTSVAFSPAKQELATAGWDGTVKVFTSTAAGEWQERDLHEHEHRRIRVITFSRDGAQLASADDGGVIVTRELPGGVTRELRGHGAQVFALAYDARGELLASGDQLGDIRLWDRATGRLLATVQRTVGEVVACMALDFSPDGDHLAAAYTDGVVAIWDLRHYDRHMAGNLSYQLDELERAGALDASTAARCRTMGVAAIR
jgi:WD40 repeat protein